MSETKPARAKKILVVDDDEQNLKLIEEILTSEGYSVELATNGHEALDKVAKNPPHVVLLDMNMPGLNGLETLAGLRRQEEYVSVIFVSGRSGTEDVICGLDAGADDYVRKPFSPSELLARVRAQLRIKDLNDRLAAANDKLKLLVDIDDLTGLYNMRSIYQKLDHELERARRYNRTVGVVMMDMDNFKLVNDTNDHLFGSFVLSKVGQLIRENIRTVDFAARYGGDEFLIVLTEITDTGAFRFTDRLRALIASYLFKNQSAQMRLTASFGVAVFSPTDPYSTSRDLVRAADMALYEAKRSGKNCYVSATNSPSTFA